METKAMIRLQRHVRERTAFLEKVVPSVLQLIDKYGKETERHEGDSHTRVKAELRHFGGFSFDIDCWQTTQGGNTLRILTGSELLLNVYWQSCAFDIRECRVVSFQQDGRWQRNLLLVFENYRQIAAERAGLEKREAALETKADARMRKKLELLETARRLGLYD